MNEESRGSEELSLTRTEYELLRYLSTNNGKVLTHRELLDSIHNACPKENFKVIIASSNQIIRG